MKNVILIGGAKRSGKDFISNFISNELQIPKLSFAGDLKSIVKNAFEITDEELEEYKNNPQKYKLIMSLFEKDSKKNIESILETNFRKILQRIGTESIKPIFGKDIWVKLVEEKIKKSDSNVFVISDFRFKEEYEYFKNKNYNIITIKIKNDNTKEDEASTHSSEKDLEDFEFDIVLNNTEKTDKILDEVRSLFPLLCENKKDEEIDYSFIDEFLNQVYWKDILGYMALGVSNHITNLDCWDDLGGLTGDEKDLKYILMEIHKQIEKVKNQNDMKKLIIDKFLKRK